VTPAPGEAPLRTAARRRILFVGAGAVGSYLGAFLARAGHDVTLVDPWAAQVEAVRRDGLAVTGPHAPFEARPAAVHLHEAARLPADFELAVVAVKAYDTAWAAQLAMRHLAPRGYVVSAQNCWPDPVVAAVAGAGRAVGVVMSKIGVALHAPGRVERGVEEGRGSGHDVFRVGEHDGVVSARARELAEMLAVIDGARATDNLWGERWAKLAQNAMSNPLQAMSGLGSLEVASSEVGRTLMIRLAAESARVGLALGYRVAAFAGAPAERWADAGRPETREALDRALTPAGPGARSWRASMAQDVAKGRRTEIDEMNGRVAALGPRAGVPTPVSLAVVETVHEVERGARAPAPANLELALRRADG
jgi:2-dehydropantoate 2-reductase